MQGKEKNNIQEGKGFSIENYSLKLKFNNHLRNKMRCTLIIKLIFKLGLFGFTLTRKFSKNKYNGKEGDLMKNLYDHGISF